MKKFSFENQKEFLKDFYKERLGRISSKKELEEALKKREVNLKLNLDDFISLEKIKEILENNPDEIEINQKKYPVKYTYSPYEEENERFKAKIEIPYEEIFKLSEIPTLPSGRFLSIKVIFPSEKNFSLTETFEERDLKELKEKVKKEFLEREWEKWKESEDYPGTEIVEEWNPLAPLPELPSPLSYTKDPETGEEVFSYPAFTIIEEGKLFIKYFPSLKTANKVQSQTLEIIEKLKGEEEAKKEAIQLEIELERLNEIYENLGEENDLEWNEKLEEYGYEVEVEWKGERMERREKISQIKEEIKEILEKIKEKEIEKEGLKKASLLLEEFKKEIEEMKKYFEARQEAKETALKEIEKHFKKCPLCGKELKEGWYCDNFQHNLDLIDFEVDEEGRIKEEIVPLAELKTDQEKVVAQLFGVYDYYRGKDFPNGGVVLETWEKSDFKTSEMWSGEPFKELKYQDFHKILSLEEAQKRKKKIERLIEQAKLKQRWKEYQEDLEYALGQVKEKEWKKGKFKKGRHPKTGEEQWEITFRVGKTLVKYVVSKYGRQPTSENLEYFYSINQPLVDLPNFKLYIVNLEPPLPEEQPEPLESFVSSETQSSEKKQLSKEEFQGALKKLKEKFKK